MSRTLNSFVVAGLFCLHTLALIGDSHAQAPRTGQPRAQRPRPEVLRAEKLSPELEKILVDWANATNGIQKLEGSHYRYVYDTVFNVEKRSFGKFYYEAPDKGRIDIEARPPKEGEVSRRVDKQTNKPFEIQPDTPEKWISTGKEIKQVNVPQKQVDVYPIPPQAQGKNIMDGPLPFLFGMPPEKAKQRYEFVLLNQTADKVWLAVKPKWQSDAANYREAKVILDRRQRYLPVAVQLLDPTGNRETVYTFQEFGINKNGVIRQIFGLNPFNPALPLYRTVAHNPATQQPAGTVPRQKNGPVKVASGANNPQVPQPPPGQLRVPSVRNLSHSDAENLLRKVGFVVKKYRGEPAPRAELKFIVYEQVPKASAFAKKGDTVHLRLYDEPQQQTSQR